MYLNLREEYILLKITVFFLLFLLNYESIMLIMVVSSMRHNCFSPVRKIHQMMNC